MNKLFLSVLMLFAATLCRALPGHAPDFEQQGIYYYIDEDDPSAVCVTYKFNATSSNHQSYVGDVVIPSQVEYEDKTYTVKGIAPGAFAYCNVGSVTLPSTLTHIDFEAFIYCSMLKSLELPSSLTTIGYSAFKYSGIERLDFPNGITHLPDDVCKESKLKDVTFPEHLKSIAKHAFYGTSIEHLILPLELETIGSFAFYNIQTLADVAIPSTLKSIEEYTFCSCKNLATVTFSPLSDVTTIGPYAFANCSSLQTINIPASVVTIDEKAFSGCALQTLTFREQSQLKTIGPSAFQLNPLYETVTIPASVDSIGYKAFYRCRPANGGFPVTFESGSQLRTIGSEAFEESYLQSIILPSSLKSILSLAFKGCNVLESCVLQEGLETIGDGAFNFCPNLASLTVPASVNSIGVNAFISCSNLVLDLNASTSNVGQAAFKHVKQINITDKDVWMRLLAKGIPYQTGNNENYWGSSTTVHYNGSVLSDYVIPEGVDTIVAGAFYNNKDVASVTFPNSLKYIGRKAFYGCTNLNGVVFGNGIKEIAEDVFQKCTAIESCDIGDIKNWCEAWLWGANSNPLSFAGKVTLKGSVLDEITIPANTKRIGNFSFYNCRRFSDVTIPTSVTSIGKYAFYNCSDLETVTFKTTSKVDSIDIYAFYGTGIASIKLPASVSAIENYAFANCKQLASINIPVKVKKVSDYTFQYCSALATVTFPEGLESIGQYAFRQSGLSRIAIPSSLKSIGSSAFSDVNIGVDIADISQWCNMSFGNGWCKTNKLYVGNELVSNLTIPANVTTISLNAFQNNTGLQNLIIPEGVTSIGSGAFSGCSNMRSVTVPSTLESVGTGAFNIYVTNHLVDFHITDLMSFLNSGMAENTCCYSVNGNVDTYGTNLYVNGELVTDMVIPEGFTSLGNVFNSFTFKSITFPSTLESLTSYMFSYCRQLTTVYCKSKFAPELSSSGSVFPKVVKTIYVPKGRANNYKTNWSSHSSIIKETDQTLVGAHSAESIAEMKAASKFVNGQQPAYWDMTDATLDGTVTAETLKDGDDQGNTLYYLPEESTISGDNIIKGGKAENVVLNGNEDMVIPEDKEFVAENLTYNRSFPQSSENAYTLCLPYDYTLPDGLKAYTLKEADAGSLVFTEVESIKANEPYLVMAKETIGNLDATNVTMQVTPDEMEDKGTTGYEFRGTLQKIGNAEAASMGAYILQANKKWHPVSTEKPSAYIQAGRAYLVPSLPGAARMFQSIFTDDSPTSIRMVSKDGTEQYFDLQGHKLEKPVKGINIVNGKKVIIK